MQLVKDTSAKLKEASETDHRSDVAVSVFFFKMSGFRRWDMFYLLYESVLLQQSKKIADAKLAKDFEAVLKEYQKAQHLAAERETSYTPFDPKGNLSSRY